jgi:hypothetical protein
MSGIAEPSGQRRAAQSLNRFHVATIAWQGQGWRIPFSAPLSSTWRRGGGRGAEGGWKKRRKMVTFLLHSAGSQSINRHGNENKIKTQAQRGLHETGPTG